MAIWKIKNLKANTEKMAKDFNLSEVFSTVLANRKLLSKKDINTYLNPSLDKLNDLLQMKGVKEGFDLLNKSLSENKKIFIYGDYDVDGVCSTVILYKTLKNLSENIFYYIPNREEEGYGLNLTAINNLKEKGCYLIFTCDNGIASVEEVEVIKELGMEVIILDHHEPRFFEEDGNRIDIIPKTVVIDPKVKDCKYPFKYLCAAALSYRFVKEFYKYINKDLKNEQELLVFASIATICDIVDLVGENRIIAKNGIEIINNNKKINLGLSKIIEFKGYLDKKIDEFTYGFIIGPCINASGRLESALNAVELFITDNENKANNLSKKLILLNEERKNFTNKSVSKIIKKIQNSNTIDDNVLVIYDKEIHESIAGIVAGRIKETYFKPTIVISKGKDICKGSGRSIANYNIFEEILKVRSLFTRFGGHPMAIGFSIPEENIDDLRKNLNENFNLSNNDFLEVIYIDKKLDFKQININLAKEILSMKPNGKENKAPIFATKNVSFSNINFIGKEKNILKLEVIDSFGVKLNAISFDLYDKFKHILENQTFISQETIKEIFKGIKKSVDLRFDILYYIEVKQFNNSQNIQLNLKDLRIST